MRRLANFILGAMIGAFVGAATTILLTPSSGDDIRAEMRDRFSQIWGELQDAAQERRVEMEGQLAEMRKPK